MSFTNEQAEKALKPLVAAYLEASEREDWNAAAEMLHPDTAMVFKGHEAVIGKQAVVGHFKSSAEQFGKTRMTLANQKYEGVGDFLIFHADFVAKTEKHEIYHDEYEMF